MLNKSLFKMQIGNVMKPHFDETLIQRKQQIIFDGNKMPYSLFEEDNRANPTFDSQARHEPERIPISMIDDLIPPQYTAQVSNKIRTAHRAEDYYPAAYSQPIHPTPPHHGAFTEPAPYQHYQIPPPQHFIPAAPQPQVVPTVIESFSSGSGDYVKELKQIKYILISVGVIGLLIFIVLLFRRTQPSSYY